MKLGENIKVKIEYRPFTKDTMEFPKSIIVYTLSAIKKYQLIINLADEPLSSANSQE